MFSKKRDRSFGSTQFKWYKDKSAIDEVDVLPVTRKFSLWIFITQFSLT